MFDKKNKKCKVQVNKPYMCSDFPYGRKGEDIYSKECGYKGRSKK